MLLNNSGSLTTSFFSNETIDNYTYADENKALEDLINFANLTLEQRQIISQKGAKLVQAIRDEDNPGLMEVFLAEYGLSTDEGIALMCLAEALLRVPDADTIDTLIEDKIASSDWAQHKSQSTSPLVNASTWALMLTGKVLKEDSSGPVGHLHSLVKRLGEPVIRKAVNQSMKELGKQFVLGEDINAALKRAKGMEKKGYTYSYDMLGEAAITKDDAATFYLAYSHALSQIAASSKGKNVHESPGISVKLSALFPRYDVANRERVLNQLVHKLQSLALLAKSAGIGINVDAEEADRLALSLEVIEQVLSNPSLENWNGFGVVVQAYGQRASHVIDTLYELTKRYDRKITVRLVKGAYWDSEIKKAQESGMSGFPVFTTKSATDVSYIANAKKLLGMTDRIYPQFATHNAHTVASILHLAGDRKDEFEFQRLHGMGEQLHKIVKEQENTRCRVYAPVGAHEDLLAYLVRRLLENGANSSFVNQVVDEDVPVVEVASDPFTELENNPESPLKDGTELFQPERKNSRGWDLNHGPTLIEIDKARDPFKDKQWTVTPLIAGLSTFKAEKKPFVNPAIHSDIFAIVQNTTAEETNIALEQANAWNVSVEERSAIINKAADLYEQNYGEIFALLHREAGKTMMDVVAEIREAVDFMRYYAAQARDEKSVGVFACIAPWNFPLAIFTGQLTAALAAGNGVIAKPAEQTPTIAYRAIQLFHEAGVPENVIQMLSGGGDVGAILTSDPRISGVCFTGSTNTAQLIRRSMAKNLKPGAPLIAETGGLNAMIVDSTALPEQAVTAVVESAFQSTGQRCSALRCLYVQEDIAENFKTMLYGAMDELSITNPWLLKTDSGPVIDEQALGLIQAHIDKAEAEGRLLKQLASPEEGTFLGGAVIQVDGIKELEQEIFGPVLHLATFKAEELDDVIEDINNTGYGLTFGLQTRIDDRVQKVCEQITAGNIYVNRNQIGAIVGTQPFGGHGLSGTGPKAGGPNYLERFYKRESQLVTDNSDATHAHTGNPISLQTLIDSCELNSKRESINMPGYTGESNTLSFYSRSPVLCLGPGKTLSSQQAKIISDLGGTAIEYPEGIAPNELTSVTGFSSVMYWGDENQARDIDQALATFDGAIIPLLTSEPDIGHVLIEQHVCVDTTASGGNAELLAGGTS